MLKTCFAAALAFLLLFAPAQAQQAQSYRGHLDDTTDTKDYTVSLKAGADVLITADAQSGSSLDPVLTLYNPGGQQIASNDDADASTQNSRIGFVAHDDGVYRVNISRYDDTTSGGYELDIVTGDESVLDYDEPLSGKRITKDSVHFRLHYTTSGMDAVTPEFLDAISAAFENAWHMEIDKMGWPAPPSDDAMGGNSLYDVYIKELISTGDEDLGYTDPQLMIGDNPNTSAVEKNASTSYIAIDNDFKGLDFDPGQDAVSVMRSTAIHEFNHAIQFGFDGLEPHTWLAEASAVWMETAAAGKDQDGTDYVQTAFQYPELCLGTTAQDGSIMYGEWPFLTLLTDQFGKDAVLNLWRQIADYDGFDAVQHYLQTVGTTLPHEAADYRINNLARDYKLAPLFKATVWLEDTITGTGEWTHGTDNDGVQGLGASYFAFATTPGVYDVDLRSDGNKLQLWALGVTKDNIQAIDLGRGGGIDTRNYQYTYLMVFNPTYDNDVDHCKSIDYKIRVNTGKGTTNPVDSTWDRTYFEPLKPGD